MNSQTISLVVLRVLLGWYMFADGFLIVINPQWSAAGFLDHAKTFPAFYAWFAQPANLWWVNPLNEWGIVLVGVALIVGVGVRPAAWGGFALMLLYYFPHYAYPFQLQYGFFVEEHIINAAAFAVVALFPAAGAWGLGRYLRRGTFLGRIPFVRSLI